MPPKKDNKNQNDKPDNTGIPKNDTSFKFTFSIQTGEQLPQCVVMYEWFSGSDKLQRFDTGLVQNWTKKQNCIVFEKSFDSIRVDDDFCRNLSTHNFYIYFINPQTSMVQEQIHLDYSPLLMVVKQPILFQYTSRTIKVHRIDSFCLKLQADKQLLGQGYREYLNPMEVQVIGALDVPFDSTDKYLPTYVKYRFYDGSIVETPAMVGQEKILWQHKHVFLVGLMNPHQIRQKIRANYLKFEFHDRDQVQNNKLKEDVQLFDIAKAIAQQLERDNPVPEDPKKKGAPGKKEPEKKQPKKEVKKDAKKKDAKIAQPVLPKLQQTLKKKFGVAVFSLVQFLKPGVRAAKYKSPVIPRTMFQDFESRNIDLNTTARNQMQKIVFSNNYFDRDTTVVVGFTLSYPIGSFVQKHSQSLLSKQGGQASKVSLPATLTAQPNNFERVVVFLPYKDKQNIQKLEAIFYQVNLKSFNLKNKRELTTYLLKSQEKNSVQLDYLSGLEIIDPEGRVYIIEGVKGKSINKIYQALPKEIFNKDKQKILKNTKILFNSRIYHDFNIELKRIRFRPSLAQILLDPSIYIKSKVDQKICQNLNKISELRRICDDLQTVSGMNLWPDAQILIQIQRKYSQSLTYQDINGQKQEKKQKGSSLSQTKQIKTIDFLQKDGYKFRTADDFFNTKIQQPFVDAQNNQTFDVNNTLKKTVHTKTFVRDNPIRQTCNFRLNSLPLDPNEPVYIYGSQKLNCYEKQKQDLRQKIQTDKSKIYTMSKDYMSLSIDPHTLEGQAKLQLQMSKSKNFCPQEFSSLLVRTKQERQKLPKQPGPQDIANMIKYPYHEAKQRQLQIMKSQRDRPINNGADDFRKYLKKTDIFSQPQVLEIQKMARVQQQRLMKQDKLKREQCQRKQLLGDAYIKTKKGYCSDKVTDVDKYTNILEGLPTKKGIIDLNKKSRQKRPIENYEVSLYLKQKINNPAFNPLERKDDQSRNIVGYQFNHYQKPQVLTQTGIYKPLKQI